MGYGLGAALGKSKVGPLTRRAIAGVLALVLMAGLLAPLRALAGIVLGVAAASVLLNALLYLRAARHRRRHPPPCPFEDEEGSDAPWLARTLAWLGAFGRESMATALVILGAPAALRPQRIRPVTDTDRHRPIVLVHGPARPLCLARRLRHDGWRHLYYLRHASGRREIARGADRLGRCIDRILQESGAPDVHIVAHGAAGLVARAYVDGRGGRGVGRLITLGTPHQSAAGRPLGVDCTSVYSLDDALVVPAGDAYCPGAFNIELRRIGHFSLLVSRRVYELVRENLPAAPLTASAASLSGAQLLTSR